MKQPLVSVLRGVRTLFTDIDDTMTTRGQIPREAFAALWDAREAGLDVVPVTGRPAGWCDHIARMWPVAGVVGENGALYYRMWRGRMTRVYACAEPERHRRRLRLQAVARDILRRVPRCRLAADQSFREHDLAVDYCEDIAPLSRADVDRIVAVFREHGANVKVSSIHVNGWFGAFDKLTMVRRFIRDVYGLRAQPGDRRFAFAGDSPNDEPMFGFFPISFGVANVRRFLPDMQKRPAYVTRREGGAGFAQVVKAILAARRGRKLLPAGIAVMGS